MRRRNDVVSPSMRRHTTLTFNGCLPAGHDTYGVFVFNELIIGDIALFSRYILGGGVFSVC